MKKKHPIFSLAVFESIRETIGTVIPESGGMLCHDPSTGVISHFHFDSEAQCSAVAYSPDAERLNVLLQEFNERGLRLTGFVHSHPPRFCEPSEGDSIYAKAILAANPDMPRLVMPIVQSQATDKFEMRVYVASKCRSKLKICRVPLQIIETEERKKESPSPIILPELTEAPLAWWAL